jgi:hypothetical protein
LGKDGEIVSHARNVASDILEADPELMADDNILFRLQLSRMRNAEFNWINIS